MKKKYIILSGFFFVLVAFLILPPASAQAIKEEDIPWSGTSGTCKWEINQDGRLYIWSESTGIMEDYTEHWDIGWRDADGNYHPPTVPWHSQKTGVDSECNNVYIRQILIDKSVKYIGENAFRNLGGTYWYYDEQRKVEYTDEYSVPVTLPAGIRIGPRAFWGAVIDTINLSDAVAIGDYAFSGAEFSKETAETVTINGRVGESAFSQTNLQHLILNGNVSDSAFQNCPELVSVEFGKNVRSLGAGIFNSCKSLGGEMEPMFNIGKEITSIEADSLPYWSRVYVEEGSAAAEVLSQEHDHYEVVYGKRGFTNYKDCIWEQETTAPYSLTILPRDSFQYGCGEDTWVSPDAEDPYWTAFVAKYGSLTGRVEILNINSSSVNHELSDGLAMLPYIHELKISDPQLKVIGEGALKGSYKLDKVILSDFVEIISKEAFAGCVYLDDVTFGTGLKEIGERAFANCYFKNLEVGILLSPEEAEKNPLKLGIGAFASNRRLVSVTLGDQVTEISDQAFENCDDIINLSYSDKVTSIGARAFRGCLSLKHIPFGTGLTTVGDEAFAGTGANNLYLPPALTGIGSKAFCYDLKSGNASLKEDAMLYVSRDYQGNETEGMRYAESNGIPYEICDGGTLGNCSWRFNETTGVLTISGEGELPAFNSNFTAAPWSFYTDRVTGIEIGGGITSVARESFGDDYMHLESVFFGPSVTTVKAKAFYKCTALNTIEIPDTVTTIGNKAFGYVVDIYTAKDSVNEDCTLIVGRGSAAEAYAVENGINYTYSDAGGSTGDCTYSYSDGTLTIRGEGAMADYASEDKAPWYAYKDEIRQIFLEEGVTTVGANAFKGYQYLSYVSLPETLTEIHEGGLGGSSSIAYLYIPDGVESIVAGSIGGYSKTVLYAMNENSPAYSYKGRNPAQRGKMGFYDGIYWRFSGFFGGRMTFSGSGVIEGAEAPWRDLADEITAIDVESGSYITGVGDYAFADLKSLREVSLYPYWGYIKTIGKGAFAGDTSLKTFVSVPRYVTEIAEDTFKDCSSLQNIALSSIRTIGPGAFEGCSSLVNPVFDENLAEIGERAFAGTALASLEIPSYVKEIGACAFCGTALTEVEIPTGVRSIGDYAFGYVGSAAEPVSADGYAITAERYSEGHRYAEANNITWINPDAGDEGEIHWDFDVLSRMLIISGEGEIPDDVSPWSRYEIEKIVIEDGITGIGANTFRMSEEPAPKSKAAMLVIPGSVKTIGDSAFENRHLKSVNIPLGTTSVGKRAFACTYPKNITIGGRVQVIGDYAFVSGSSPAPANEVIIPKSVNSIGAYAFGYLYNSGYQLQDGFTIKGIAGTEAERYANQNPPCVFEETVLEHVHILTEVFAKEATETEAGNIHYYACEECDEWFEDEDCTVLIEDHDSVIIPKTGEDPPVVTPKISKTKATLKAGKTLTLKVTDGTVKTWKSSKTAVAAVTSKGVVTAKKKGTATITATLKDGTKLTCKITVSTSPTITVGGKKFKASTTYKVKKGRYLTVKVTGRASSVANVYSTTKKTIAKVTTTSKKTSTIKIKGLKKGSATVTIKINGVAFKIKVKVTT